MEVRYSDPHSMNEKVEDVNLLSATNVTSALFAILVGLKTKDTRLVNICFRTALSG